MIDPTAMFRAFLLTDSATAALVGDRIASPDLPKGGDPLADEWLVLRTRGGPGRHAEIPIDYPSVQVTALAPTSERAWALYQTVKEFAHGKTNVSAAGGVIVACLEEVQGQEFSDPDTGWPTVVGFFGTTMRAA